MEVRLIHTCDYGVLKQYVHLAQIENIEYIQCKYFCFFLLKT